MVETYRRTAKEREIGPALWRYAERTAAQVPALPVKAGPNTKATDFVPVVRYQS